MGQNFSRITEERGFTNPHIRFRRIRGRIVPIFNKKRIGQDISKGGEVLAVKGAAAIALTLLAKKTKIGSKIIKKVSKFSFKTRMFDIRSGDGFKTKAFKAVVKMSSKATSFTLKNSGKLGAGLLGAGIATKLVGDEVQVRSRFGKDFFFIKDRSGRGS